MTAKPLLSHTNHTFSVDDLVLFDENDRVTNLLGKVVRVWSNGKYISIRTYENGKMRRLFVRDVRTVVHAPREATKLAAVTQAEAPPVLTVVTVLVRYDALDSIYQHPILVSAPFQRVSDIVKSYAEMESGALLDWRVDEYAPIPF